MIDPSAFFKMLNEKGIDFFTGVPDSLLKDFNAFVSKNTSVKKNIIAANEGAALSIGAGYYLATGKYPLVYLQNSGLGNLVNPLLSLVDKDVYSIPILILIGWRGEPGKKDEPQHMKQGRVTTSMLEAMEIPFKIIDEASNKCAEEVIKTALLKIKTDSCPYVILVPKNTFADYKLDQDNSNIYNMNREETLKIIVNKLSEKDIVVSTTGKTSRELFEYRENLNQSHERDFLTVGSMGHANQIALGIALNKPQNNVFCFDGDGAVIMHMGSIGIIGDLSPNNFKHIIFNNGSHESVGGQPTIGHKINFEKIFLAAGYNTVIQASTIKEVSNGVDSLIKSVGPSLLQVFIKKGARANLGRPTISTHKNKEDFMNYLKSI